jgi:hypothetical protein
VLLVVAFVAAGIHLVTGSGSSPVAQAKVQPPVAPAGFRLVGYGQFAVAVPASWGHNLTSCGAGNTVIYPDAALAASCVFRQQVSSVSFSDPLTSPFPLGRAPREIDPVAGQQVFDVPLPERAGVVQRIVIVPGAGFQMMIRSRDASVVDAVVASLQVVPKGYTVVPVCERLLLRDAAGRLKDAQLRLQLTQASYLSQRYGQPPVVHQSIAAGTIVPTGTSIGIGFPSMDE